MIDDYNLDGANIIDAYDLDKELNPNAKTHITTLAIEMFGHCLN